MTTIVNHNNTSYSVDRANVMCVKLHFQQHFSCFVEVSFISGVNRSTPRKPPTYYSVEEPQYAEYRHENDGNQTNSVTDVRNRDRNVAG